MPAGRNLRICFVCDELPPAPGGGIGSFVRTVGTRLRDLGHDVIVTGHYPRALDWPSQGPLVEPILPGSQSGVARPFSGRRALFEKVCALHVVRPIDIVEWPNYQGPFLRNAPGTTDVVRLHSPLPARPDHPLSPKAWFMQWMRQRTLREIPNWIAVSRWVMDDSLVRTGAQPKRRCIIPNPVNCELFHPPKPGEPREKLILFVGGLVEIKGAFTLARSLRTVLKEFPGHRALFIGRDPDGKGVERIRDELGHEVTGRVEIRGQAAIQEIASEMRRAQIVAAPGDLETFGMVWAEAMASGAALIAADTAAGPETVPHWNSGILVEPGSIDALIKALQRLITNQRLRDELGKRARELTMKRFALEKVTDHTLEFYRQCLEKP